MRRRDDAKLNKDQSRFKFLQKYSQMRRKLAGLQSVYGSKTFTAKIHKALCPTLSPAYMTSRCGCKYVLVCRHWGFSGEQE